MWWHITCRNKDETFVNDSKTMLEDMERKSATAFNQTTAASPIIYRQNCTFPPQIPIGPARNSLQRGKVLWYLNESSDLSQH